MVKCDKCGKEMEKWFDLWYCDDCNRRAFIKYEEASPFVLGLIE